MQKAAAILLFIIAVIMIYLGSSQSMVPPILTWVGFIIIGAIYLTDRTVK